MKSKLQEFTQKTQELYKVIESIASFYEKMPEEAVDNTFFGFQLKKTLENNLFNIITETQQELQLITETLPNMLLKVDKNGYIKNVIVPEGFPFNEQELLQGNLTILGLEDEVLQKLYTFFEEEVAKNQLKKMRVSLEKNEKKYFYQMFIKMISAQEISIVFQDITQEEKNYKAIISSEKRWKDLLRNIPDMVSIIDKDFNILFINHTQEYNYENEEIVNTNILQYLDERFHTEIRAKLRKVFESNEVIEYEYPFYDRQRNNEKIWFSSVVTPFKDDDRKEINKAVLISRDITQRKKEEQQLKEVNEELSEKDAELSLINEELNAVNDKLVRNQDRLENTIAELENRNLELDNLVYKISHDIRSPLASLMGLIEISKGAENIQELKTYLDMMENRASKLDNFIKSMLIYARSQRTETEPKAIDFEIVIKDILRDMEHRENYANLKILIQINLLPSEVFICDPLRLHVIFSNIISNAIKYQNRKQEESFLKIEIFKKEENLHVNFQDNGIGIEKNHIPRIYEMFYRATQASEGSGLGLYIVKQSVDKLKGKIQLQSQFGIGTTIQLQLPFLQEHNFFE